MIAGLSVAALKRGLQAIPYDDYPVEYADEFETTPFDLAHRPLLGQLPPTGSRILDVGAGAGRDAAELAARGFHVTAVEPSYRLQREGKRRRPTAQITWLADSLPTLNRVAGQFDMILVSDVWRHLLRVERPQSMARIARLLAPGGRVAIHVRGGAGDPHTSSYAITDRELWTQARNAGLEIIEEASWNKTWFTLICRASQ